MVELKIDDETNVSHVESDLQVPAEVTRKFRIESQDIKKIVPVDFVKVTISEGPHITGRLSHSRIDARIFPEDVVLAEDRHYNIVLKDFYTPPWYKIEGRQDIAPVN